MNAYTARNTPRTAARFALSPTEVGLILLVACSIVVAALLSQAPSPADVRTTTVRVGTGDSLWEIARRFPVRGLSTGETVDLLVEMNELDSASIAAGSEIRVPAPPRTDAVAMR